MPAMSLDRTSSSETIDGSTQRQQISSSESRPRTRVHVDTSPPPHSDLLTRLQIYSTRIPHLYVTPFCGASAGVASGIVTCPLDVIKTKLQEQGGFQLRRNGKPVESGTQYRGMVGTGRIIWRDEGVRGMYRGLGPMLLGYLPTWAIYLTLYDRTRDYFYHQTG